MANHYITLVELAKAFGLNVNSLRRACREGRVEARKSGKVWLTTAQAIETALRENKLRRHRGRPPKKATGNEIRQDT